MLAYAYSKERQKPHTATELGDIRFRRLLAQDAWAQIPEAVKRRFSKKLQGGETAIYAGTVKEVRTSKLGRIIAQSLRLIGAPLPVFDHVDVPTIVTVTEDVKTTGQIWTRMYCNRAGFPQVIHSAKRFAGPTGLEEYVGFGISMALRVEGNAEGLTFQSAGYYVTLGKLRVKIPRMFEPGRLTVKHMATTADHFRFEMTLTHPLFGELIHQAAEYQDGVK
jgi:Domain of unknown function (DUF4166)